MAGVRAQPPASGLGSLGGEFRSETTSRCHYQRPSPESLLEAFSPPRPQHRALGDVFERQAKFVGESTTKSAYRAPSPEQLKEASIVSHPLPVGFAQIDGVAPKFRSETTSRCDFRQPAREASLGS